MSSHPFRHLVLSTATLAMGLATGAAHATVVNTNLITNGSLTAAVVNDGVPAGWTIISGSPDVSDVNDNVGTSPATTFAATPSASPDGGTWVGLGFNNVQGLGESFGQAVSGLAVGQTYTLTWYDANFGYNGNGIQYLGSNAIGVTLNGQQIGQGSTLNLAAGWHLETLTFVATATSEALAFDLTGTQQSYVSIDGINLYAGSTAAVPEPEAAQMFSLGLVGLVSLGGLARKRRQQP